MRDFTKGWSMDLADFESDILRLSRFSSFTVILIRNRVHTHLPIFWLSSRQRKAVRFMLPKSIWTTFTIGFVYQSGCDLTSLYLLFVHLMSGYKVNISYIHAVPRYRWVGLILCMLHKPLMSTSLMVTRLSSNRIVSLETILIYSSTGCDIKSTLMIWCCLVFVPS